jgi:hypothetical protein
MKQTLDIKRIDVYTQEAADRAQQEDGMNLTPHERTMLKFFQSEYFQSRFQKEAHPGTMYTADPLPIEKENIALTNIQNTIGKHGYVLDKVPHSNQFRAVHPEWKAKDLYLWLDDQYQVCCDAGNAKGLTRAGLNPVLCPTPSEQEPATAQARQVGGEHYASMAIQPWQVMRAVMTREEYTAYHIGTVLAYLMRHKAKGGEQDIKKAQHHLTELVEYLNAA